MGFTQTKDITPDPAAKVILDKVEAKYKGHTSIKTDFSLNMEIAEADQSELIEGSMSVAGDKFRLTFGDQEIISDNTDLWTVMHDVKEVQVDFFDPELLPMQPTDLFSINTNDFYYVLMGTEKIDGETCDIVELTPNNKEESYFKIKLWISQKGETIIKTTVFEKTGNRYTYSIKNFEADPSFGDSYFMFSEEDHPDYLVTDLR